MGNRKAYRRHDNDFKRETIALVKSSDKSMGTIAKELGIHPNTLTYWMRKEDAMQNTSQCNEKESEDTRRLRKELEDVKLERDILKKVVAIFSKQPK